MTDLFALGAPCLTLPTRTLGPGKAVALLTYLSVLPSRSASRKELFKLLYSESTPRDADAFRQLLASLRKTLPGTFVTSGDSVQLTTDLDSDRRQFLDACHRGDDELAVTLYEREFFEDFSENGCDGFLKWAAEERLRLRRRFELAAESIVRRHLLHADWTAALAIAWNTAERFPQLMLSSRLLIETLTLAGRAGEIRATLAELSVGRQNGSAAQVRNLDRLFDDVDAIARDGALANPAKPITCREREFRTLVETWTAARSASGGALLITGDDGTGRTRLLAHIALRLRLDTPSIIRDAPQDTDTADPFALITRIAASVLELPGALGAGPANYAMLRTLANPATLDAARQKESIEIFVTRAIDALTDGLRASSEEAPVALLLDDLHLADASTLSIIGGVATRVTTAKVLLVVSSRDALAPAFSVPSRQQLTLGPLDQASVGVLLRAAGLNSSDEIAQTVFAATTGTPRAIRHWIDDLLRNDVAIRNATTLAAAKPRGAGKTFTAPLSNLTLRRTIPFIAAASLLLAFTSFAMHKAEARGIAETLTVLTWRGDSVDTRVVNFADDVDTPSVSEEEVVAIHWPLPRLPETVSLSPDGRTMAVQIETDGLNTMDIVGVRGDSVIPLVVGPRDDASPAWSPDGTMLAFQTNRWSDTGNEGCDIGVLHVAPSVIWRVTSGPDCDGAPAWSPDGTRLAFHRISRISGDSAEVCTLTLLSEVLACRPLPISMKVQKVVGWRSQTQLLLAASLDTLEGIYEFDVNSGSLRSLIGNLTVADAEISPSRSFAACWCNTTRAQPRVITLLPLNGGRSPLQLPAPVTAPFRHIAWHAPQRSPAADRDRMLERLAARDRALMRASPVVAAGATPRDSLALARAIMRTVPSRPVTARIAAPLPSASARLAAIRHASTDSLRIDESWSAIDSKRWVSFGTPRPRASVALSGLDPAGDGSYPSGVYSRESFPVRSGIIIEAVVRVPVTLPYWQEVAIGLESDGFVRSVRRWNHRTGIWPSPNSEIFYSSGIKFPATEGAKRATLIAVSSAGSTAIHTVAADFGSGREILLTLSVGPRSTMSVTADGRLISSRRFVPPPSGRMHVFIMGHSVESDVRVRALRIWSDSRAR